MIAIEYVETYLGCDIFYYTPPDVPSAVYGSPCITGHYFKKSAVKKRICESKGGTWEGGKCSLGGGNGPAISGGLGLLVLIYLLFMRD